MSTEKKPTRELAARLAKQYGLSPEDTADLLSLADSHAGKPVADLQALQAEVIAAPFKPGAVRGPQHAARNALATALIAVARGDALPLGSPGRDQILTDAGLQAPPKGDPAPTERQKAVGRWHMDVQAAEAKRAKLRATIDNRTLPSEVRAAAREELARTPIPPPPAPPPVVHD